MKIKAITLLILFMSFIALPTVLSSISCEVDISMAYTLAEEEENHKTSYSEVFEDFKYEECFTIQTGFNSEGDSIIAEFLLKHDNLSSEIFSPPPEQKLV